MLLPRAGGPSKFLGSPTRKNRSATTLNGLRVRVDGIGLAPVSESMVTGRWPTQAVNSIWSEALFDSCCDKVLPENGPLQIGLDCARFGDDDTAFAVRKGGLLLHMFGLPEMNS